MIRLADNWNEQILPHAWSGLVSQRSFWLQQRGKKIEEKRMNEKGSRPKCFSAHFKKNPWESCCLKGISEYTPLCHRFWLNSHINTLKTHGWSGIRSLLNIQSFSSSSSYLWIARCSVMVEEEKKEHKHLNLYSCRSFLKNIISKPEYCLSSLAGCQSLLLGSWKRLCRTLLQSLPSVLCFSNPVSSFPLPFPNTMRSPPSCKKLALPPPQFSMLAAVTYLPSLQKKHLFALFLAPCLYLQICKGTFVIALKSIFIVSWNHRMVGVRMNFWR